MSEPKKQQRKTFGFICPKELEDQISEFSQRFQVSKGGIARLAITRGLPILERQLTAIKGQKS